MKRCAYCNCENEDSVVACRGCGEALVEGSPAEPEASLADPALSPVIVATFSSLPQAKMLADRLEASGIEAEIPEEYAPQVFSGIMPMDLVTVRVAAKDYEAAKLVAAGT